MLDAVPAVAALLSWPDRQRPVGAAVQAGLVEGETNLLACLELPVASHFDVGEVDETAAWYLRSLDYTPAFVSVEPLDHSCHCTRRPGRVLRHGLIVPSDSLRKPWGRSSPSPSALSRCQTSVRRSLRAGVNWRLSGKSHPLGKHHPRNRQASAEAVGYTVPPGEWGIQVTLELRFGPQTDLRIIRSGTSAVLGSDPSNSLRRRTPILPLTITA